MAMIGVRIAALGLALAVSCPSPQACAFGLRLGPFLLGWRAHHHHRHVVRRQTEALRSEATPTDVAQSRAPSLLYPILAWPSFADDIFRPINYSSWPFSYQSIFDQAFAEYPAKRVADLCPRQIGKSDATLRIEREIAPTAAQQPLLQKLSMALAQANGYLIKLCPAEIPPLPVERLQLMDSQIDAMTMALEIVRVPLQKFEQSLDDRQRARLSALVASEDVTPVCAKNPEPANWPMPISSRPCYKRGRSEQPQSPVPDRIYRRPEKSFRLCQLGDGFCKLCGGTRNASPSVCVSDRIDSDHSGNPADLSEKGCAGIPKIREALMVE